MSGSSELQEPFIMVSKDTPLSPSALKFPLLWQTHNLSERLPDEIWRIIIGEMRDEETSKKTWWERWDICSCVCRRWRGLTISYMFRHVPLDRATRDVPAALEFFSKRPWIAKAVQTMTILYFEVDIAHLDSLLSHLPYLRSLHMDAVKFIKSAKRSVGRVARNYVLDRLVCTSHEATELGVIYAEISNLLLLFSDIGELELSSDFPASIKIPNLPLPASTAQPQGIKLQVRSLKQRWGSCTAALLPLFLTRVNALQHLTTLSFEIGHNDSSLTYTNEILLRTGRTLRQLSISMSSKLIRDKRDVRFPDIPNAEALTDALGPGLEACSEVEIVKLSLAMTIPMNTSRPVLYLGDWSAVGGLLTKLPCDAVQSIALEADVEGRFCAHSWSWKELQDACRRFTDLRSLDICFNPGHPYYGSQYEECVHYEMRAFKTVLAPRTWWTRPSRCVQRHCGAYNDRIVGRKPERL